MSICWKNLLRLFVQTALLLCLFEREVLVGFDASKLEVQRWFQKADDLMADRGEYKGLPLGTQFALAEPLLRSAWQNKSPLDLEMQRQIAVRLNQTWLQANNLLEAWNFLFQIEHDEKLFACNKQPAPTTPVLLLYSCAELDRLGGTIAYTLHTFPRSQLDSDQIACSGLEASQPGVASCLSAALEKLRRSEAKFTQLGERLASNGSSSDADRLAFVVGTSADNLAKKIRERRSYVQIAIALALQESANPKAMIDQLRIIAKTGNPAIDNSVLLHWARGLRDLKQNQEARAKLDEIPPNSSVEWLSQIVGATLDIRQGDSEGAANRLTAVLPRRESSLQAELGKGSPLNLTRRLAASDNSDDILISSALKYSSSSAWQKLLSRYAAYVFGAGDSFLRLQFASWRTPEHEALLDVLAQTTASQNAQWNEGELATERRRIAYEELAKKIVGVKPVPPVNVTGDEIWKAAWAKMRQNRCELLIIFQHRPFAPEKTVAEALGEFEYTAVHYRDENSAPVIRRLGSAVEINRDLNLLSKKLQANQTVDVVLERLGKLLQFPAITIGSGLPRRLVVIANGEFQQAPWSILPDQAHHPLLENWSIVQVSGLREVAAWKSSARKPTTATFFGVPDLSNLAKTLSKGQLEELVRQPAWEAAAIKNSAGIVESLKNLGPTTEYSGGSATETNLVHARANSILHIQTHGAYMAGLRIPPNDRSVMLFAPDGKNDGILLASEASMMRLDGTLLVTLAACTTGRGRPQRNNSLIGFRAAFHDAGAKAVIAPIWEVPEGQTSAMMKALYSQAAQPWDEALRKAQLRLHKEQPGSWAGWVISGDPF